MREKSKRPRVTPTPCQTRRQSETLRSFDTVLSRILITPDPPPGTDLCLTEILDSSGDRLLAMRLADELNSQTVSADRSHRTTMLGRSGWHEASRHASTSGQVVSCNCIIPSLLPTLV